MLQTIAVESTSAGIVTAVAGVITAIGGLVLALGVFVPVLRNTREVMRSTSAIHTIVNQQRTDLQRYQQALVAALNDANVKVPIDQSVLLAPASIPGGSDPPTPPIV